MLFILLIINVYNATLIWVNPVLKKSFGVHVVVLHET